MNEQEVRKILEKLYEQAGFEYEHRDIHPDRIEEAFASLKSLEPKHCQRYDEKGNPRPSTLHEILCIDLNISDCELVEKIIKTVRGFESNERHF